MFNKLLLTTVSCVFAVAGAAGAQQRDTTTMQIAPVKAQPALTEASQRALLKGLKPADEIAPRMTKIKTYLENLQRPRLSKRARTTSIKNALSEIGALDKALVQLNAGFKAVENADLVNARAADDKKLRIAKDTDEVKALRNSLNSLKGKLEDALKDLEAEDRLGNFEIQDLMSRYNQSEQLASSVQKKKDDTASSVIGKVG